MFFLSGAAALVYEVAWVRSLGLVFGGSHLAVTTVLSIFMAGLAVGGYTIGKIVDRVKNPLALYGALELGIALSALIFIGLMKVYPSIYVFLVQGREDSTAYLTSIRVGFALAAMIVPTTFMGGTLPVLSRIAMLRGGGLGSHLSFLYGINTLGAVAGTAAAGFYLLRYYSLSAALATAIVTNVAIGFVSIMLWRTAPGAWPPEADAGAGSHAPERTLPERLVLWGIGVSGFCALGYEVLWTRVLTIVVGASVYGFSTMLAAFLTGIALGSKAYGLIAGLFEKGGEGRRQVAGFGAVQAVIGITALFVTVHIRDLPADSIWLQDFFARPGRNLFEVRQLANLSLAFLYMVVPAFFMGFAFPLAGTICTRRRERIGSSVGNVLLSNTAGAILGAAAAGYALAYVFGAEQSLQMLSVVNIGLGLIVIATLPGRRSLPWAAAAVPAALLITIAVNPAAFRVWDAKYFAIFRSNQPEAFRTPEMVWEAIENTDVLYYAEGIEATVSSIRVKGGNQAFLTNGRVEASSSLQDQQVQYTLGHLPMLLHPAPRNVLVVGLGSGMTLGATSVHPSLEKVTLVELEPRMTGVARTFRDYNHNVLDNPRLRIVFNDGRNFLLTTKERFDVITADPIHPWFRGAGYLYTTEYFRLAAGRLNEGGVLCQWLPIYELTVENLRSVVRTLRENFRYTMLWMTYYDAVIIGSNSPIRLDPAGLERRLAAPGVKEDLSRVMMGSARDFLSYFALGSRGMNAFSEGGIINTDDNLYLEFSAPLSMGKGYLMRYNAEAISRHREGIRSYLASPDDPLWAGTWHLLDEAAAVYDRAHEMFLGAEISSPKFLHLIGLLERKYQWYGPGRFLSAEYYREIARQPRLLLARTFLFSQAGSRQASVEVSAVMSRISEEMAIIDFVDNRSRTVYGQLRIPGMHSDESIARLAGDAISRIEDVYREETEAASLKGRGLPAPEQTLGRIPGILASIQRAIGP